jgi:hypothetical protein
MTLTTTVSLDERTKDALEEYKDERGHTSFDSAVRELLLKAGEDF